VPELPNIVVYLEALATRIVGQPLERVRLASPFLLRSFDPPLSAVEGRRVVALRRIGKRIVIALEGDLHLVLHLMIAGRLRWKAPGEKLPGKVGLAAFDFPNGTLILTEQGTKKRASLYLVRGEGALDDFDKGGLEVLEADAATFRSALLAENHTLKRALTDPRILSGIGNAFSDEILHRARLSPVQTVNRLSEDEIERLYQATRTILTEWTDLLREETGEGFPEKVTAFHPRMAMHGRYGKPCPDCGTTVQRIVYADNETNYCPRCQTGGRLLADRSLSRLLHGDWPKTIDELEDLKTRPR
jgi:formamidopyrimidine-DNA glycosylase